jgi:hypothetical protein
VRDQLKLIRLRNNSTAFDGTLTLHDSKEHELHMTWDNGDSVASLSANLFDFTFAVTHRDEEGGEMRLSYR